MATRKIQVKKKKSITLVPKPSEKTTASSSASAKAMKSPEPSPAKKKKSGIEWEETEVEEAARIIMRAHKQRSKAQEEGELPEEQEIFDASDSVAVELNSPDLHDHEPQIPLKPDEAETTAEPPTPGADSFKFYCYRCGQRLKVPVSWANKSTPCGRCGHDLVIPPPLIQDLES